MVQAPKKFKKARKANVTNILTLMVALAMLVLVGIFFRVGMQSEDEPRKLSAKDSVTVSQWFLKVAALRKKGQRQEALVYSQKIVDLLEKEKTDNAPLLAIIYVQQSDLYRELGLMDKASQVIQKAKELVEKYHMEEQNISCEILLREGICKFANKEFVEADDYFQQALTCSATLTTYLSKETNEALLWLAETCLTPSVNKPQKAMQYLRAVEEVCSSSENERPAQMMTCQKVQGIALITMKKYSDAEEKLVASQELAEKLFKDPNNPERIRIGELLKQARTSKN